MANGPKKRTKKIRERLSKTNNGNVNFNITSNQMGSWLDVYFPENKDTLQSTNFAPGENEYLNERARNNQVTYKDLYWDENDE